MKWLIPLVVLVLLPGCREQRDQLKQAMSGRPPVIAGTLAGDWQLADLNGGGAPSPAISLRFDAAVLAGSGGCNRFTAPWQQDGRALAVGALAVTRMACAPAVMAVEQRFLSVLGDVDSLVFSETGEAMLATKDGRRLRLQRPADAP